MIRIWKKSSYSTNGGGGGCVELDSTLTAVRDSKNPQGPELVFPPGAVGRLLAAVKKTEQ
jgi:hypothetical protein